MLALTSHKLLECLISRVEGVVCERRVCPTFEFTLMLTRVVQVRCVFPAFPGSG